MYLCTHLIYIMKKSESLERLTRSLDEIRDQGTLNGKNADRSENLHRLFLYPAMMVPETQSVIIKAISEILPKNTFAIDPYMGSGTSLMSCMEFGFNVFGQDINPLAVLLSKAKVALYDMEGLQSALEKIKAHILNDKHKNVDVHFNSIDKWFNKKDQIDLSIIRRAIMKEPNQMFRNFFWVIIAEVIRTGSNDRTSTFKLHKRSDDDIKRRNIDNIKNFISLATRGIEDLNDYKSKLQKDHLIEGNNYKGIAEIVWGNTMESINTKRKFDILVSSPPYGDNQTTVTYGQNSYLPLQWIDSADLDCSYDYLRTTQEIDRVSLGGIINSKEINENKEKLFAKIPSLAKFYNEIPENERKIYNKTLSFIKDFEGSLDKIIDVMKPEAFYVWTIGNRFVKSREVPNDTILIDLMHSRGIELFYKAERQILNKKQPRMNNYSKTMEKEQILIFHKNN